MTYIQYGSINIKTSFLQTTNPAIVGKSKLVFVPFNSWDFKITKTFKYNISFTGVYEMNQSFINYQVLTGGKISF
jgi:hypothetical protein